MWEAHEKLGGRTLLEVHSPDFNDCIKTCGLHELNFADSKWTWSDFSNSFEWIVGKIDRVLVNDAQKNAKPSTFYKGLPASSSDHNPLLILLHKIEPKGRRPFKFLNRWTEIEGFLTVIKEGWSTETRGSTWYKFMHKLKALK